MKNNKRIKKDMYECANAFFADADPEQVNDLVEEKLLIEDFDKKAWASATKEQRENKEVLSETSLKEIDKYDNDDLFTIAKECSGKYYGLVDEHNQLGSNVFKFYDTHEHDKYQSDQEKLKVPYYQINTEDKSIKDKGTFNNLEELKNHLLDELNEYAGLQPEKTKPEDIKVVIKMTKDDEVQEMAFISEQWGNHHMWVVNDARTIEMLEQTIDNTFSCLEVSTEELTKIPDDWKGYENQTEKALKELKPQSKGRGR